MFNVFVFSLFSSLISVVNSSSVAVLGIRVSSDVIVARQYLISTSFNCLGEEKKKTEKEDGEAPLDSE